MIAAVVLVAVIVRAFLLEAFWIPSESMSPTLAKGDRVLVNRQSGNPARGDVVVFKRPPDGVFSFPGCGDGASPIVITRTKVTLEANAVDLIKRVVGLPGDEVSRKADGTLSINGSVLDETYLPKDLPTPSFFGSAAPEQCIRVPPGEVFVLGDNRGLSAASNVFGPIEESSIIGHAVARIWPPARLGGL